MIRLHFHIIYLEADFNIPSKPEHTFIYLQLITACHVVFAHSANDVANAIGSLAAIVDYIQFGVIGSCSGVAIWFNRSLCRLNCCRSLYIGL